MRKFKETKKQFDKVREDLELALVRNAQAPRHRPHEVEEATGALTMTRKCFRHLALDYVLQVGHWVPTGRVLEWGLSWSGRVLEWAGHGVGGSWSGRVAFLTTDSWRSQGRLWLQKTCLVRSWEET